MFIKQQFIKSMSTMHNLHKYGLGTLNLAGKIVGLRILSKSEKEFIFLMWSAPGKFTELTI